MAPAFRPQNTPKMTEKEFQKYRRKVFHRGWDIDESIIEDGADDTAPITEEVLQEWRHYRQSVHEKEADRNGGKKVDGEIEIRPEEEALIPEELCEEWRTYIRRYRKSIVRGASVDEKGVEDSDEKKKPGVEKQTCEGRPTNQKCRSEETELMSRVEAGHGIGVEEGTIQKSPRKGKRALVEEGVKALQRMLLHR